MFELYLFKSLIILDLILSAYLIAFWYPSKLIKVALPFFLSLPVILPAMAVEPLKSIKSSAI